MKKIIPDSEQATKELSDSISKMFTDLLMEEGVSEADCEVLFEGFDDFLAVRLKAYSDKLIQQDRQWHYNKK